MGNRNWMRAREALLDSDVIPGDLERLFPICTPGASDSASFDEVLELLHMGGRSLPHAVLMMIPEAWENHQEMDAATPRLLRVPRVDDGAVGRPRVRGLHRRFADRRRPRPQRAAPEPLLGHRRRTRRARLRGRRPRPRPGHHRSQGPAATRPDVPGRRRRASDHRGRRDQERARRRASVRRVAARRPDPPRRPARPRARHPHPRLGHSAPAGLRLHPGGAPGPARTRWPTPARSRSARWARTPRSRLSATSRGCCSTTSRRCSPRSRTRPWTPSAKSWSRRWPAPSGRRPTCSSRRRRACRQVVLPFPVFDNDDLAKIRHINRDGDMPGFITHVSRGLYEVEGGGEAMARRIDEVCAEVSAAIAGGARVIVLSDRHCTAELAPIPSLLLTGAVHHHLVREKTRTQVGLLVEAGDVREVHHVALLIGYGAAAVNPYLAMESVEDLARDGYYVTVEPDVAVTEPDQGPRQGRAEGDVQDGRVHCRVLHRRPDLRGARAVADSGRPLLHRHHVEAGWGRSRRHRRGGRPPSPYGVPPGRDQPRPPRDRGRRRVPVAA